MLAEPSFEQIVLDHQQMVFRTLARLLGRRAELDDLAQEVFLRLFRALPGFRNEALVSTYLYRITVNVANSEYGRWSRRERNHLSLSTPLSEEGSVTLADRLEDPGPDPEQALTQGEFQAAVEHHLARLKPVERTVLILYHQEQQSYGQIAASLQMPIGTIRTHLHRGRGKLKAALAASQETAR